MFTLISSNEGGYSSIAVLVRDYSEVIAMGLDGGNFWQRGDKFWSRDWFTYP